jgi:hypothetical protein
VFCKQVTGENNMRCLKAKFGYLNAWGVSYRLLTGPAAKCKSNDAAQLAASVH